MIELSGILFFGFLLDQIIGDPPFKYHPIRLIGRGISALESLLRNSGLVGRGGGILLVLGIEVPTLVIYIVVIKALKYIHPIPAWGFNFAIFYSCLALKDLFQHIRPVVGALKTTNLPAAREAIAKVVGRDVNYLDEAGIIRAAIETMSENLVDGFLTPLFWFLIGGVCAFALDLDPIQLALSLMLTAKVASTLDSMVGYKNSTYLQFGWAGARFDDLMNFIPARISLAVLLLGAWISGLEPATGLKVALKDRLKHDSPNAAHAESFTAGTLKIRLGGPSRYAEGMKNKPWLGEAYADPTITHIGLTQKLIMVSSWIAVSMACAILLFIRFIP
jgi:adenosylcobinamide-phosphate synthase